jgi:ParB family chromosome partitioning protein
MPKNSLNVSLKGADDIFSTEESRQEQQREQVQQIPIGELFPFKNHPFKVLDDESMQRTVESVEQYGVLSPLIARPRPEGGYEIISGHRRQHAAQLAGLDALPVIVRQILMPMFPLSIPSPHLALLVLPERILLTVQSM